MWDCELLGLILGLVGEKVGRKMSRNLGFGTEMCPKCLDLILGDLRGFGRWVGCWYGLGFVCRSGGAEIGAGVGLVEKKGGNHPESLQDLKINFKTANPNKRTLLKLLQR